MLFDSEIFIIIVPETSSDDRQDNIITEDTKTKFSAGLGLTTTTYTRGRA